MRDGAGLVVLCEGVDTLGGDEGVFVLHRRWERAGDQERLTRWLTATAFCFKFPRILFPRRNHHDHPFHRPSRPRCKTPDTDTFDRACDEFYFIFYS